MYEKSREPTPSSHCVDSWGFSLSKKRLSLSSLVRLLIRVPWKHHLCKKMVHRA